MASTVIRGTQILNNTVQRQDLDVSTVGQAVVTKLVQGTGITLSSTGADSGTGDVTVSAASSGPSASTPVVLGETAADAFFTGGIIVPQYKNHPDGIWTYGTFDDHFDAGSINAKWSNTQTSGIVTPVYTQAGSQLCLGGASAAANATLYENSAAQNLPVQATHQISLKAQFCGLPVYASGTQSIFFLQLEYGTRTGGVSLQWLLSTVYGQASTIGELLCYYGAGFGGSLTTYYISPTVPPYWRMTYDASKNTTFAMSFDGITWMNFYTVTAAQSGFSTNTPNVWRMGISNNQLSVAFAQFDWIRHV